MPATPPTATPTGIPMTEGDVAHAPAAAPPTPPTTPKWPGLPVGREQAEPIRVARAQGEAAIAGEGWGADLVASENNSDEGEIIRQIT